MAEAGVSLAALDAPAASPGLRRVLDRCLDGTENLMVEARRLPGQLKSRSLAMESAVIVRLAEKLILALRRRDPLAERVVLSKPRVAACALSALAGVVWRRLTGRRGAPAPARTA